MPQYKRRSAGPKRMTVTSRKFQIRWEYLEARAPAWIKPSLVMSSTFVRLAQSPNFASSASHWIKAALHTVPWPFYALMQPARNPPSSSASENFRHFICRINDRVIFKEANSQNFVMSSFQPAVH